MKGEFIEMKSAKVGQTIKLIRIGKNLVKKTLVKK